MKYTHSLERIVESNKSGYIRSDDVLNGIYLKEPKIGHRFRFYTEPMDPTKKGRVIDTSPVTNIFNGGFTTESGSKYTLLKITE